MARKIHPSFFAALALALGAGACDTQQQQNAFAEDATRPPSGYARTDEGGRVLDDDPDDWRTSPAFAGLIRVQPAFPNPSIDGRNVFLEVTLLEFGAVRGGLTLRGATSSGRLVTLADLRATDPGTYALSFSPVLLGRLGLLRVFLFDGLGELVSYGDVMVE